jgi:Flp pilus assembly protein TadG
MYRTSIQNRPQHRGAILLLTVLLIVVLLGMVAFAVDLGYLMMAKTQLQAAADSAALAAAGTMGGQSQTIATNAAKSFAAQNLVGTQPVQLASSDITYGTWDKTTHTFTAISSGLSNAAKVTARAESTTSGAIPLFFGRIFNLYSVNLRASATATCNPRDICFVVDLSGSMNNDTDPNNTGSIDPIYPGVGTTMMQNIYSDFGYGTYPGTSEAVGKPFNVSSIASLSSATGPLSKTTSQTVKIGSTNYSYTVPTLYRIKSSDSSSTRTKKAYSWVMDQQLRGLTGVAAPGLMPAAKPTPNSTDTNNYNYWFAYLSGNSSSIGYKSYMSYMMYYGRTQPTSTSTLYSPLSLGNPPGSNPDCPSISDTPLEGGSFNFPPREMPTHASRLAIIDALQIIKQRNQNITDSSQCDWVSIVTFDLTSNVTVLHTLDNNYDAAMQDCTKMQACNDNVSCTSTETGFIKAINLLTSSPARSGANKVVVLLTDGKPNLYSSSSGTISNNENTNPNSNYYGSSSDYPQDAAMMQTATMQGNNWSVFPVELGLEGDDDFMNRIYSVAMGKTAQTLTSPYGATGDPTYYEQELIDIFTKIISNPKLRLVQ